MHAPALDNEALARLKLHLVPGLGPRLTAELLRRFGSATKTLNASPGELVTVPRIGEQTARQLAAAFRTVNAEKELATAAEVNARLLYPGHADYPAALQHLADPPVVLFQLGTLLPSDARAIAIVGSRQCTDYGRRVAQRLGKELAAAGFTVVSGLARGIDGCAHRAALEAGGRTIAILASGLARVYPPEHKELAQQVTASGALLSETPMKMAPLPEMFPRRNRLISGISLGVVIVEATEESGALITARHALDQDRDVFAVPGPIDSATSAGPLRLLRDGAILVRKSQDILDHYSSNLTKLGTPTASAIAPPVPPPNLPPLQLLVWEKLATTPLHMDELVHQAGINVAEAGDALLHLELAGRVRRLPGNRFERRG
jgi:DNA processing protein